mgnify:CR=1 FL=1
MFCIPPQDEDGITATKTEDNCTRKCISIRPPDLPTMYRIPSKSSAIYLDDRRKSQAVELESNKTQHHFTFLKVL